MELVERRLLRARRGKRAAAQVAVFLAWSLSSEAQEIKLNGPLVRQVQRAILGFGSSVDAEQAFLLGDFDTDDEFELIRVNVSGAPKPITLSGPLVPGGDVGGNDADTLPFASVIALSPSGTRIVYAADQLRDGRIELFSVKPQGGTTTRLNGPLVAGGNIALGRADRPFRITPDETRVLYLADQEQDEVFGLFMAPIDGGATVRLNPPLVQGGDVADFQISPDGREVVYRADQVTDELFELFAVPVDGSAPAVRLGGSQVAAGDVPSALDYEISPDSRFVVFRGDLRLDERFDLFSARLIGAPFPILLDGILAPGGDVLRFSIAPAGTGVVFLADALSNQEFRLFYAPIRSRVGPRELTGPMVNNGDVVDFVLAPFGELFVYSADQLQDDRVELFAGPLDGSTPPVRLNPPLVSGGDITEIVGFSRNAERVLYRSDELTDEQFSLFSAPLRGDGSVVELSAGLIAGGDVAADAASISPDGRWGVYVADQERDGVAEIFSAPVDGSAPPRKLNLPLGERREIRPGFEITADSAQVLYLADHELNDQYELHAVPIDGGHSAQQITHTTPGPIVGDVSGQVVFTPDGTRVLYRADQEVDETFELFSVPTDGSEEPLKLNPTLVGDVGFVGIVPESDPVQVSPDGQWAVYYATQDSFQMELYSVPVDGSAVAVKLNGPLVVGGRVGPSAPAPSSKFLALTPDSTRVVYWATQLSSSRADLFLAPIDGHSAAVRLNEPPLASVRALALAPAGDRIVYIAGNDLFSVPLDGSSPPVRLHAPFTGFRGVAVFTRSSLVFTPDGSRVLYLADPFLDEVFELFTAPVDGSSGPVQLSDFALTGEVGSESHAGDLSESVQVSADGLRAVFAAARIFSRVIDGSAPAIPLHPPLVLFQEILGFGVSPVLPIAVFGLESPDPLERGRLYSAALDGSTTPLELDDRLADLFLLRLSLSFAAGGTRVIYSALQDQQGQFVVPGLRSAPVDGGSPALWLNPPSTDAGLARVSPDGNRVVFLSGDQPIDPRTVSISVAPVDGSSAAETLNAPLPAGRIVTGLFPDPSGRLVLYVANRAEPGVFELFADPTEPQGQPSFRHR